MRWEWERYITLSGSNRRGGKGAGAVVLRKWKLALGLNVKDEGLELKLQVLKTVGMLGFQYFQLLLCLFFYHPFTPLIIPIHLCHFRNLSLSLCALVGDNEKTPRPPRKDVRSKKHRTGQVALISVA